MGTKVSEAEFALLEERARGAGLTLGEWVREALLAEPEESGAEVAGEVVLAELLALRTLFLNLRPLPETGDRRDVPAVSRRTGASFLKPGPAARFLVKLILTVDESVAVKALRSYSEPQLSTTRLQIVQYKTVKNPQFQLISITC